MNNIDRLEIAVTEQIEKALCGTGWFRLEHNGESAGTQSGELSAYYTRKYRMYLDGKSVNTCLWFRYNRRDGWADVDIRIRDVEGVRPSEQELSTRKLVKSLEKSMSATTPSIPTVVPATALTDSASRLGMTAFTKEESQEWKAKKTGTDKSSLNEPKG
jgi:hypothetical protein